MLSKFAEILRKEAQFRCKKAENGVKSLEEKLTKITK